ncbi:conserved hypothetical protein [Magnetococcus marinus MC-1]|uniref:STAS domain-containing protein n=1 Tax=Magnetococcus marinus (strain ATCC BAA-1437 / JCM 17883 / MC-1) TaxID=156889 RepID=A0LC67_MAGMM|nr:STAS domain-containing protein [Magnetococcus marinus]ABK45560.1 conserved hypothetical protein [Magnetococcus marinus MC-1]
MPIHTSLNDNELVISLVGSFSHAIFKEFKNAYLPLTPGPSFRYCIDLSQVKSLDSSVLGMFLMLRAHAGEAEADITLRNPTNLVLRMLLAARFDTMFKIVTNQTYQPSA